MPHKMEQSEKPVACRRQCGERMRPICYVSNVSRLTVIPVVWWGIFGFGGSSGVRLLQTRLGLGSAASAAIIALILAGVSTATLLPCGIHRRIMRRRKARCGCAKA